MGVGEGSVGVRRVQESEVRPRSPFVFAQACSISGIKKFVNLFLAVKLMINTNTQAK